MNPSPAHARDGWLTLTPRGALHAFASSAPDGQALLLQSLLAGPATPLATEWLAATPGVDELLDGWISRHWVQPLGRALQGPDTRLDDFVQHVIASLSGERRAVLASDSGFCLGRAGLTQDEADTLSAAAADFSDFARRQARRGWSGASRYVAFCSDPELLLPDVAMLPFWVDGAGYWLVLGGEPLVNNPALVELVWGIKEAGQRFRVPG